ncbi:MAG: Hsp20/alpha crystallin family protein [Dehalococcoidia bacterium]|nr:Hsp20/alpha crystallin family protein [Dehalococcoidia bacterium]
MVVQRWEPFSDIVSLRDAMDRLFEQSVVRPARALPETGVAGARLMPVDVYEKDSDYVVKAYVPAVKAEEVEISAERETVSIKVHIPGEVEKEDAKSYKWLASELGYGDVVRVMTLPMPIDASKIEAQVENGVLTVVIPKAEEAKPKKIVVKSK